MQITLPPDISRTQPAGTLILATVVVVVGVAVGGIVVVGVASVVTAGAAEISADDSMFSSAAAGGRGAHSTDSSEVGKWVVGDEVDEDIVVVSAEIGLDEQAGV